MRLAVAAVGDGLALDHEPQRDLPRLAPVGAGCQASLIRALCGALGRPDSAPQRKDTAAREVAPLGEGNAVPSHAAEVDAVEGLGSYRAHTIRERPARHPHVLQVLERVDPDLENPVLARRSDELDARRRAGLNPALGDVARHAHGAVAVFGEDQERLAGMALQELRQLVLTRGKLHVRECVELAGGLGRHDVSQGRGSDVQRHRDPSRIGRIRGLGVLNLGVRRVDRPAVGRPVQVVLARTGRGFEQEVALLARDRESVHVRDGLPACGGHQKRSFPRLAVATPPDEARPHCGGGLGDAEHHPMEADPLGVPVADAEERSVHDGHACPSVAILTPSGANAKRAKGAGRLAAAGRARPPMCRTARTRARHPRRRTH